MWTRLKIWVARWLTRGTDCTVVRANQVNEMLERTLELQNYVEKSGALNDSHWIHAWRRVHGLTTSILACALKSEVL